VLKRWQQLKGKKAILCTGTDEHGLKVQKAAEEADIDPQAFCDKGAETFKVRWLRNDSKTIAHQW
jgi:methionyl-tRNA synthetase